MPRGRVKSINDAKAKDFKGTLKKLIKYLSRYKVSLFFVCFLAIFSSVFSIVGPKIMGKATTEIFNGLVGKVLGTTKGINFDKIAGILLTLLCLYIISSLFSYLQAFIMSGVNQKVTFRLREEIFKKMHKLPLAYFEKKTTGEILSRVTNDVDTLSQSLDQSISQVLTSLTTLIGVVVMMLSISPLMTLVTLIIIPIAFFMLGFIMKHSQKYFLNQQKFLGDINGTIEEAYSGNVIVKLFNGEKKVQDEFLKNNERLYESSWKAQFFSGLMQPIMNFIGNLGYDFISILGGILVIKNKIEVGDILSFSQYVRNFMNPLAQLAYIINMIQSMIASSERIFEFLEEEEEVPDKTNITYDIDKMGNEVTFTNVQFGYLKNKTIIHDFNASVHNGEKIAIVGPTGAGKTTIVKLLMRFYDVDSGSIKIDGVDIRDMRRDDLRSLFGMVLQDAWLYSDTIKENIRYGDLMASDEKVYDAAIASHVDHFIRTLPEGYDMVINEDSDNVSSGQKQLLTIARVILKNPKILILDEATSSVDTRMESLIQKAMDHLMEGRTSFVIAHRLSTIKNANLILVMKDGDIVEVGNHEELLKKNGEYAELYNSQFEEIM